MLMMMMVMVNNSLRQAFKQCTSLQKISSSENKRMYTNCSPPRLEQYAQITDGVTGIEPVMVNSNWSWLIKIALLFKLG